LISPLRRISEVNTNSFRWCGHPHAQPPTWRNRVSLFVWAIAFYLSGMGGPASRYATISIVVMIIRLRKPHH
jgi:hypothetical protein